MRDVEQVEIYSYPAPTEKPINLLRQRADGSFIIPYGEIPPAPFADNCADGAWDCLEQITTWFFGQRMRSADD